MAFEERQAQQEQDAREEAKRAKLADDMQFATLLERIPVIVRVIIESGPEPRPLQMIEPGLAHLMLLNRLATSSNSCGASLPVVPAVSPIPSAQHLAQPSSSSAPDKN